MSTCVGGAPGKSAPHLTRTTTQQVESMSSLAQLPAFLLIAGIVLAILLLAFRALYLLAQECILGMGR